MWTDRRTIARALTIALIPALHAATAPAALAFTFEALDLGGAIVSVPAPEAETLRIVINVPARRLFLVEGPRLVDTWPVAVGKPATPTPVGRFQILQMAKDPTWAPKGRPAVPPGPHNPLGTRWMRISADGYGIHATNDPGSIGHARSHGCVRMRVADAEALYERVSVGTPVEIVYEIHGWEDDIGPVTYPDLYALAVETHP
jgi:lipoprotein-anchoring transpeptidase ErfK/SrfK